MSKITLEEYCTGPDGKRRDLLYPQEWIGVKDNAIRLLNCVNQSLAQLFPSTILYIVSSGWRPKAVNSKTPGAAKGSLHTRALAIDLRDPQRFLASYLRPDYNAAQAHILRENGLFLESFKATPGWCHLDLGERADRPSRIFLP